MVMPVPLAILTVWSGLLLVIVKVPLLELTPIPVPAMMPYHRKCYAASARDA
jgi:hypothetical protein